MDNRSKTSVGGDVEEGLNPADLTINIRLRTEKRRRSRSNASMTRNGRTSQNNIRPTEPHQSGSRSRHGQSNARNYPEYTEDDEPSGSGAENGNNGNGNNGNGHNGNGNNGNGNNGNGHNGNGNNGSPPKRPRDRDYQYRACPIPKGKNPYINFYKHVFPILKDENPGVPLTELAGMAGDMWQRMSTAQKAKYKAKKPKRGKCRCGRNCKCRKIRRRR